MKTNVLRTFLLKRIIRIRFKYILIVIFFYDIRTKMYYLNSALKHIEVVQHYTALRSRPVIL